MSDTYETRSESASTPTADRKKKGGGGRRFFLFLIAVLLAFGAGFGWQWWEAREVRTELETVRQRADSLQLRLTFQELGNELASALMQSTYGNYEPARQAASDFFTGLQQHAANAPAGISGGIRTVLAERDATITALSRNEADSRDRLARLYIQYRRATGISAPDLQETGPPAAEPAEEPGPGGGMEGDTATGRGPVGSPRP